MGTIAAFAQERDHPLTARLRNLLGSVALCVLASACSQFPFLDSEPQSVANEEASAAPIASAVSLPQAPSTAARAAPQAVVPTAAVAIASPAPIATPQAKEAQKVEDLESPHAIDLARPADDLWERIRAGFAISDLDNPLVGVRERWYASQGESLQRLVERSTLSLFSIVEEIEKRGMPTEIALLPMVESAFNPMAYSRSHASGLWQFIPSTGKNYKLSQNWWADSRRDVIASTNAALDYLQVLYEMHGDWHLALASYNWGENGVARAIERNRSKGLPTDYQSLKMPAETRGYIPKLQAMKNIISDPEAFGVSLDPIPNEPYFVTVPTPSAIDIRLAAELRSCRWRS